MPPPPPLELTLVLAATRDMGIGLNGTLPWTGLKREMAYFARVTKRLPPSSQVCRHVFFISWLPIKSGLIFCKEGKKKKRGNKKDI